MKSWQAADKIINNSFDENTDQVVFQKIVKNARENTHKLLVDTIRRFNYDGVFQYSTAENGKYTIVNKASGSKIIFREFKDPDNIKGLEGFRHVWIDEADQCSIEAFNKIDDSLRRYADTNIILTFNPVSPFCWIKTKLIDITVCDEYKTPGYEYRHHTPDEYDIIPEGLWLNRKDSILVHWSSYLQNSFLPQNYFERKDRERKQNLDYWKVNDLGFFGSPEGLVFPNFEIRDFDYSQFNLYEGIDWGWTHPFFYLKVAVSEQEKVIYVCEEFAGINLKNETIKDYLKAKSNCLIYADSAEPKTIDDFLFSGINITGVNKSAMTVEEQIRILQTYKIVSHTKNKFFNKQAYLYKYPENGLKDTPVKINDDGYDCLRYALFEWFTPSVGIEYSTQDNSNYIGF